MTLTERMAKAAEMSKILEWEAEWDRAQAAVREGTLDRVGFELIHSGLQAAQDRYLVILRSLKAEA